MQNLWHQLWKLHARVLRRVSHYHWFGVLGKHVVSPIDRAVIKASRGRLSMTGPEFTTMLLTTTGRKSGKQRTIPVHYVGDGKKLVAVCENFGLKTASSQRTCSPTHGHASRCGASLPSIDHDSLQTKR